VYVLALLFAIWGIIDVPWSWWYTKEHSFGSPPGGLFSEMQSIAMVGILMILLIVCVLVARISIWKKGLLPKKGRTRITSIFFERIVIVFLVFYVPTITFLALTAVLKDVYGTTYFWIERSLQLLSALQVLVTLLVVSYKPDIRNAMACSKRCQLKDVSLRGSFVGATKSSTFRLSAWMNSEAPLNPCENDSPISSNNNMDEDTGLNIESCVSDLEIPNKMIEWELEDVYDESSEVPTGVPSEETTDEEEKDHNSDCNDEEEEVHECADSDTTTSSVMSKAIDDLYGKDVESGMPSSESILRKNLRRASFIADEDKDDDERADKILRKNLRRASFITDEEEDDNERADRILRKNLRRASFIANDGSNEPSDSDTTTSDLKRKTIEDKHCDDKEIKKPSRYSILRKSFRLAST